MRMRERVAPFAGIGDVGRAGLPVEVCASRVGRFGFVSKQLMRVQAARMPGTADWDFKAMLGRQLWECAVHWGQWRERVAELRGHEHLIDHHADGKLNDVFDELLCSRDDVEFAAGLYQVVLPAYREALQRYLDQTNPLVDQPTARLIRHVLIDLDEQLDFGRQALAALVSGATRECAKSVEAWSAHLQAYLDAAGGIDGALPERPSFELPTPRSVGEFEMPREFARDARFKTVIPKLNPYTGESIREQLLSKMWVRSQEMTAAELCASVLYEWEDLPYEGCLDLARHCWDEVRHALFGEAALAGEGIALESLPNWVGYAGHTMPAPPQKRYAHLAIATEANAMRHPGGKRGEWEWCRDAAQHPLMTLYQDFDWADEVNHVKYGRAWLVNYYFRGDRARAKAVADETVAERLAYYSAFEQTRADGSNAGY